MSVRLKFMRPERAQRSLFMLDDNMIRILKSDLKASKAAKIVNEGMSFKKLAKLVRKGSNMKLMNRLVENKSTSSGSSSSSLSQTLDLIKKTGEPNEMIKMLTAMGNAKRLFNQLKLTTQNSGGGGALTVGASLALLGSQFTIDCI